MEFEIAVSVKAHESNTRRSASFTKYTGTDVTLQHAP